MPSSSSSCRRRAASARTAPGRRARQRHAGRAHSAALAGPSRCSVSARRERRDPAAGPQPHARARPGRRRAPGGVRQGEAPLALAPDGRLQQAHVAGSAASRPAALAVGEQHGRPPPGPAAAVSGGLSSGPPAPAPTASASWKRIGTAASANTVSPAGARSSRPGRRLARTDRIDLRQRQPVERLALRMKRSRRPRRRSPCPASGTAPTRSRWSKMSRRVSSSTRPRSATTSRGFTTALWAISLTVSSWTRQRVARQRAASQRVDRSAAWPMRSWRLPSSDRPPR